MEDSGETPKRTRAHLPLNEEDLALAMGEEMGHEERARHAALPFSFGKLFLSIVLAAPVAAVLVLAAMDLYPMISESIGLRQPEEKAPAESVVERKEKPSDSKTDEKLAKLMDSLAKFNKNLVTALNKQTDAVLKLANKKPDVIKVEAPELKLKTPEIKVNVPERPAPVVEQPRIVVVKVPTMEKFDLAYEKRKVLELAGVDLDDPVTGPEPFENIKSREALKEVIRALDAIIAASRDHEEVSDFLKNNALEAKKHVQERLRKVK